MMLYVTCCSHKNNIGCNMLQSCSRLAVVRQSSGSLRASSSCQIVMLRVGSETESLFSLLLCLLKLRFSEKDTKFDEISILVLTLLSKVKNKMVILSILRPCQNIIELSLTE